MAKTYERKWWAIAITTTAVLVLASNSAWASEPEMGGEEDMVDVEDEDSDAHQKMLELSAQGNEHYAAGRIEEAAATYKEAYETYPQPILLKNQMITRFLLDECEPAIELGERFLDSGEGSDEDRADVEEVFGNCSYTLAKEAADEEDYIGAQEWLDFGEPYFYRAGHEENARLLRDDVDRQIAEFDEPADVEPHDEDGLDTLSVAGWSLTGLGALSLAGGGIWTIRWNRKVSAMESAQTREEFDRKQDELIDSYSTARWGIPALYGVGVTAAAAGVGLLLWSSSSDDGQSSAMVQPTWGGDVTGARLSVTF